MKRNYTQLITIYFILFLSTVVLSHDITNIVFNPTSPASLDWDEDVYITFDYQTEETNGIRISVSAEASNNPSADIATSGSALLTGVTGSGDTYFTVRSGDAVIDYVKLTMYNESFSTVLFEKVIENVAFSYPKDPGGEEAPYPRCNETRIIPHVTKYGGVFNTTVIIENFSEHLQSFTLKGYNNIGEFFSAYVINDTVPANGMRVITQDEIFPSPDVAYFTINKDAKVLVSVAYISTGNGSPAFSRERCHFSKKWAFLPGDWSLIFDGIAVVNMGSEPTDVVLKQYDKNNNLIHSYTIAAALVAGGKALYVLDTDFSNPSETRFVIEGTEKLSILALSGSRPGSQNNFLWENPPYPLDQ